MTDLATLKCEQDERRVFSLDEKEINDLLNQVIGWSVLDETLVKEYTFNDFFTGIAFTNKIAIIAEQENHHPKIILEFNKVTISLTTHKTNSLTKNDFILAAKIDQVFQTKTNQ